MIQKILTLVESVNRKPHLSLSPDQQDQKGQGNVNGPQTQRCGRDSKGQGHQQGQAHTAPATNYATQGNSHGNHQGQGQTNGHGQDQGQGRHSIF